MKRMKLRMWVKVVLTIIILVVSLVVYNHVGNIGNLVTKNSGYSTLIIVEWFWLGFVQFVVLYNIWER